MKFRFFLVFILASLYLPLFGQDRISLISGYNEIGGMHGVRLGVEFESKHLFWSVGVKSIVNREIVKNDHWYNGNQVGYGIERFNTFISIGSKFWHFSPNSSIGFFGDIQFQNSTSIQEIYLKPPSMDGWYRYVLIEPGVSSIQSSLALRLEIGLLKKVNLYLDFGYCRYSVVNRPDTLDFGPVLIALDHNDKYYNSTLFQIGLKYDLSKKK
jgi:hypothetical protein